MNGSLRGIDQATRLPSDQLLFLLLFFSVRIVRHSGGVRGYAMTEDELLTVTLTACAEPHLRPGGPIRHSLGEWGEFGVII
jgi:hypothetical protein